FYECTPLVDAPADRIRQIDDALAIGGPYLGEGAVNPGDVAAKLAEVARQCIAFLFDFLVEPAERLAEDVGDDFAVKFSLAQDRVAYDSLDLVDVDARALRREFGFSRHALLLPRFARRAPSSASAARNRSPLRAGCRTRWPNCARSSRPLAL